MTLRGFAATPWLLLYPLLLLVAGVAAVYGGVPAGEAAASLSAVAFGPPIAWMTLSRLSPGFDRILLVLTGILGVTGVISLHAVAQVTGEDRAFYTDVANRQGFFVCAGFATLAAGAWTAAHFPTIARYRYLTLVGALALTVVTMAGGVSVNGARLWLRLGPVQFQPSEVARVMLVMFFAAYLYERRYLVASPWRVGPIDLPPLPHLAPIAMAVLAAAAILGLQSDLGMAALVVLGAMTLTVIAASSRTTLAVALFVLTGGTIAAYRGVARFQARVDAWLDPWRDPFGGGFQFIRGEFALSAGGMLGSPGQTPSSFVPEVHTDLILVGIGSEFGVLASAALLALSALLVVRSAICSLQANDPLHRMLALGLTSLLALQTLLIVGGTLRLLPLTGVTLPLVSYGGSSMLVTFFVLGVVGSGKDTPRPMA